HVRLRLRARHARLHPAVDNEEPASVANALFGREGRQHPQLLRLRSHAKRRRHDTDDAIRPAVETDLTSEDTRIAAEAASPQLLAQHDDLRLARLVIGWTQRTSEDRLDAEHAKVVSGDAGADDALDAPLVRKVETGALQAGDRFEQ